MADTVTVGSRSHMAFRIAEPPPNPDKPGAVETQATIINGSNHPDARGGVGITRNVNASLFRNWFNALKEAGNSLRDHVFELSDDAVENLGGPLESGFEPGLKRMAEGDNAAVAAKGSMITAPGPVSSRDMAATSDTPNDDTPRGDPMPFGDPGSQVPATAMVAKSDEMAARSVGGSSPATDAVDNPAGPAAPADAPPASADHPA